jgi:hypothetical protein
VCVGVGAVGGGIELVLLVVVLVVVMVVEAVVMMMIMTVASAIRVSEYVNQFCSCLGAQEHITHRSFDELRDTNITDCLSKTLLKRAVQLQVTEVQHFALEAHQRDKIQKLSLSHLSYMLSQTN